VAEAAGPEAAEFETAPQAKFTAIKANITVKNEIFFIFHLFYRFPKLLLQVYHIMKLCQVL
jgi:hypothetical protein